MSRKTAWRAWGGIVAGTAVGVVVWGGGAAWAEGTGAASRPAATTAAGRMSEARPAAAFVRYVPDHAGGATVQAAVVRMADDGGRVVDLVAALHVADRAFYQAIDESFADYDAVLFELITPRATLVPTTRDSAVRRLRATTVPAFAAAGEGRRDATMAFVGGTQRFLRDTLTLSFQLEAIDYRRANFVHADLDAEAFARLQGERGESMGSLMLDAMLKGSSRTRRGGATGQIGLIELLAAMKSPDSARQLKLLIGRELSGIDDPFDGNTVIVGERNRAALGVLRSELADGGKRTFAVFYGAAHLKSMARSLEGMGFRQVGPPFWRVAWDLRTATTRPTTRPASGGDGRQ